MQLNDCQPTCFLYTHAIFTNKTVMNLTISHLDTYHDLFAESTRLLTIGRGQRLGRGK